MSDTVPVWKQAAWITAMVGVASFIISVPSKYISMLGDVRVAEIELQKKQEEIASSKQVRILDSALEQKGTERVFVLRYLAATLREASSAEKDWVEKEIQRIDDILAMEVEIAKIKSIIQKEIGALENVDTENNNKANLKIMGEAISKLKEERDVLKKEVKIARQSAGLEHLNREGPRIECVKDEVCNVQVLERDSPTIIKFRIRPDESGTLNVYICEGLESDCSQVDRYKCNSGICETNSGNITQNGEWMTVSYWQAYMNESANIRIYRGDP